MRKLFFLLLILVLFFGCIDLDYNTEQTFKEDGTSTLKIQYNVDLSRYSDFFIFYDEKSDVFVKAMLDYLSSEDYAKYLCSKVKGGVKSCKPNKDGSVILEVELEPGEFYDYTKEFDFLSLREVTTYKIKKVPFISQYIPYKDMFDENELKEYFSRHFSEYFEEENVCEDEVFHQLSSFTCEAYKDGGKIIFKVYQSEEDEYLFPAAITGYACIDYSDDYKSSAELIKVNESQNNSIKVECNSSQKLLLSYQEYGENLLTTFALTTIDELKDAYLNESFTENPYLSVFRQLELDKAKSSPWNFENKTFMGTEYRKFSESELDNPFSPKITARYKAVFNEPIDSVMIGHRTITHTSNSFEMSMKELGNYPSGPIEVTIVKEFVSLNESALIIVLIIVIFIYNRITSG